jgi:cytochrome c-type biogenesis protein CcmH
MTAFIVIGAALTLVAVLCVVLPLRFRHQIVERGVEAGQSNVAVLRDQLSELDADLGSGAITAEHYASARADLERRVLEEAGAQKQSAERVQRQKRWAAPAIGVLIPLAVLGMYSWVGQPDALRPGMDGAEHVTPADVEDMVGRLAARLEKAPDDPRGWMMLARSYYVMQRMPEAAAAYAKAADKIKDDADLLADYADALAMSQGRRITGQPLELVNQALKINPSHPKALAMAGTEAFYRKDYRGALASWEKLLPLLPPESEMAKSVAGGIAEARQLGGIKSAQTTTDSAQLTTELSKRTAPPQSAASAAVSGRVTLSPVLVQKARPEDTVFIVARAANGPRIPLAVLRRTVADLPMNFTLDDSMAMSPELKLSGFPEVIVSARISKSGNAISQPGDLQGASPPVKVGAKGLAIVIDAVVP